MKALRIAVPVLGLALIGSTSAAFGAWHTQGTQQGQGYGQDQRNGQDQRYGQDQRNGQGQGGWDAPPNEFQDVQRQGFRDGIQAARQDFQDQRQRPVEAHRQFRRPSVAPGLRDQYRDGFRRGYSVALQHMQNGDHRDGYNPR